MTNQLRSWDGKEWERHVKSLMRLRHGAGDCVDVPDGHVGDFGIECFTYDGFAYQSYAAKEPLDPKSLHEHIIAKINEDIEKFLHNRNDLLKLFGTTKISRWILVVPRHESAKSVQHCTKKTAEVLAANVSYVAPDFHILIQTEEDFAMELARLLASGVAQLNLQTQELDPAAVMEWASSNDALIKRLQTKLQKLRPSDAGQTFISLRDEFIRYYVDGQNALDVMKSKCPEMWELAVQIKADRERYLVVETQLAQGAPITTFNKEKEALIENFSTKCPGLNEASSKLLAFEALSDWMLRCPMDF